MTTKIIIIILLMSLITGCNNINNVKQTSLQDNVLEYYSFDNDVCTPYQHCEEFNSTHWKCEIIECAEIIEYDELEYFNNISNEETRERLYNEQNGTYPFVQKNARDKYE